MVYKYLKFQIPYSIIRNILIQQKYENIVFHIDLPSISRGFYNKQTVEYEITNYIKSKNLPTLFFEEAVEFLGKLHSQFQQYSPKFSIFLDDGQCKQNKTIYNGYKDKSSDSHQLLLEDNELELYHMIKKYYYEEFPKRFKIDNLSRALFLREYEADFLPWILYQNNIWNTSNQKTLNVILSTDKDLLQCCQFGNFIQIMTLYSKRESKIIFNVYDDNTAISQIYSKFQRGILTSKYIPLILAISGDKADKIPGVSGIGPAGAYKFIINYSMPHQINSTTQLPQELEKYRNLIVRNYKLISFEEQLKRVPVSIIDNIKKSYIF